MVRLLIVYDSRTGNTEALAKAIAEGAKTVNDVEVVLTRHATEEELAKADALILGSPTYHGDATGNIKNFLEQLASFENNLKGKVGTAFGSYGWSGEAPNLLVQVMKNKFKMDIIEPCLRIKHSPNKKDLNECRRIGKEVAERAAKLKKNK